MSILTKELLEETISHLNISLVSHQIRVVPVPYLLRIKQYLEEELQHETIQHD
jgi:hypothetical protein